jgi:AraC-like DNA-binding protein
MITDKEGSSGSGSTQTLEEAAAAYQSGTGTQRRRLVEAILGYVHSRYAHPFSLDDLAFDMKRNPSYLSALFRQTTGMSFQQYREEIRLRNAREMLCDPRHTVAEVARASGYASPDAFRHAFKAREGRSPTAWRASQSVQRSIA